MTNAQRTGASVLLVLASLLVVVQATGVRHSDPGSSVRYPSSELSHIEPIQGFTLHHIDNAHLHEAHAAGKLEPHHFHTQSNNAARSLAAHSQRTREVAGLTQPFPDQVTLTFHAFGREFHLPQMQLMVELFVPESKTVVENHEEGTRVEMPNVAQSYEFRSAQLDATATIHEDGLFHALIREYDAEGRVIEMYQAEPVENHRRHHEAQAFEALSSATPHGVVVFKHSDLDIPAGSQSCGSIAKDESLDGRVQGEMTVEPVQSAPNRRLLASIPIGQGVTRWTNCYPGDTSPNKISMGVAADISYFNIYKTVSATQAAIAATYANINLVYKAQFNIFNQVNDVLIQSTTGGPAWNIQPATPGAHCSTGIQTLLNTFTSWRTQNQARKDSMWHQFTNCYPPAGIVGIHWIAALCTNNGAGISSVTSTHWLVVAHEMGHGFGGNHAFQLGQGRTGGIMDYGNGQYPLNSGIYQFHPTYNQAEMCRHMTNAFRTTGYTPFCQAAYSTNCGNGVIESGEDCDDTSSCCVACKFKSGAVCSMGNGGTNPCCDSTTCQFKPTSVSCGSLSSSGKPSGYCNNGVCTQSVCTGFSDLTYCGTLASNACRQTCLYNGACTDSLTTPNPVIADGVVCSTSPYGTCKSGVCNTASTGTTGNKWVTSNPSSCSCSGTQTLTVQCVSSTGTVLAASQCTGTKPPTTKACTPPATCVSWKSSAWGTCSTNCGTGVQIRTVTCVSTAGGTTVDASLCAGQAKPTSSQACPNQPACPTSWVASGWTACSAQCGGGLQTQTVTCKQTQNGVTSTVAATACTGTKPATQQPCNTAACVNGITWTLGVWSTCSVTCGGGTQTRTAVCTQNGQPVASTSCSTLPAPTTKQACSTQSCTMLDWHAGAWGACSSPCGTGFQTRAVQCFDMKNDPTFTKPLEPDLCIGAKPESMQSCNTSPCTSTAVHAQWFSGTWSRCSRSCQAGGGTSTRRVQCVNTADRIIEPLNEAACAGVNSTAEAKPPTMQTCGRSACATFQPVAKDWSSCSVTCGGGVQTRSVYCVDQRSRSVVRSSFCDLSSVPTSQPCNTDGCALVAGANWQQGNWSECSTECGGGYRTRQVQCVSAGTVVDSAQCKATMPATQDSCSIDPCGTYWYAGAWSTCTQACGEAGGTQSRTVSCLRTSDDPATATPLDASLCSNSRPSDTAVCNQNPCPTYVASDEWSPCSARCDEGLQTRNVTCQAYDGRVLDQSFCAGAPMPQVQRVCVDMQCPHWHRGEWGLCSQNCGGGSHNRSLVCRMPHDETYHGVAQPDTTLCPPPGVGDVGDGVGMPGVAAGQPASTEPCNIAACPAFYWRLSPWSACSVSCGSGGVATTSAQCVSSSTGAVAKSENLCIDAKPPTSVPCNADLPCPVYEWIPDAWQPCPAYCGASTQTRVLRCYNTNPSKDMHMNTIRLEDSFCAGAIKPADTQPCAGVDESTCWGAQYASTGVKNGRCASDGTCRCRSGSVGATCSSFGQITSVSTNSAQFVDGVPLGEILLVTWNSSFSELPTVDLILAKNLSTLQPSEIPQGSNWNTGIYLASNLPNTGLYSWTVGRSSIGSISFTPGDLEFGNGYVVRIWFSPNLYQDSSDFLISDPCAYQTCGAHGTCVLGVCACSDGFSGAKCESGPCERANCREESSTCDDTKVITAPPAMDPSDTQPSVCTCTDGYVGSQCRTPASCAGAVTCLNGGDIDEKTLVTMSGSCSAQCACLHSWHGPSCETCSLTCQAGGSPSEDCSSCGCPAGYSGRTCQCRYYLLTMPFLMAGSDSWRNDSISIHRFQRTLEEDIQAALSADAASGGAGLQANATVESVTFPSSDHITAVVRFALPCPDVSSFSVGRFDKGDLGSAVQQMSDSTEKSTTMPGQTQTLQSAYSALLPLFADTDSALYHGQITSHMDPNGKVLAVDPSGQDTLAQPQTGRDCFEVDCEVVQEGASGGSSGGLSKAALIGILVSCSVVFVGLLAFGTWFARKEHQRRRQASFEAFTRARQSEMVGSNI